MNTLTIIGNLTADPTIRTVNGANGQSTVCNLTVAVNRYKRGQKVTDFFRITLWNQQAENAMKYLSKGRQVAVTGPVTARPYMGDDGKARCSLEIQDVEKLEYLGGKPDNTAQAAPGAYQDDGYMPVGDEDLPWNG